MSYFAAMIHTALPSLIVTGTLLMALVLAIPAQGQTVTQAGIDSLVARLPDLSTDTARIRLLNQIAFAYFTIDAQKGIEIGKRALSLAEKNEFAEGEADAYSAGS
jgi:chorismate synthase